MSLDKKIINLQGMYIIYLTPLFLTQQRNKNLITKLLKCPDHCVAKCLDLNLCNPFSQYVDGHPDLHLGLHIAQCVANYLSLHLC